MDGRYVCSFCITLQNFIQNVYAFNNFYDFYDFYDFYVVESIFYNYKADWKNTIESNTGSNEKLRKNNLNYVYCSTTLNCRLTVPTDRELMKWSYISKTTEVKWNANAFQHFHKEIYGRKKFKYVVKEWIRTIANLSDFLEMNPWKTE